MPHLTRTNAGIVDSIDPAAGTTTAWFGQRCTWSRRYRRWLISIGMALLVSSIPPGYARSSASKREAAIPITKQIAGTWQLVLLYEEDAGGEDIVQFGNEPKGQLFIDGRGRFSLQIMSQSGRRFSSRARPAAAHHNSLIEAISYFGVYEFDPHSNRLTLHASHCLFRNCDKTKRIASVSIHGDSMELVSAVELSPTGAHYSHSVWRRLCCER